MRFLPNIDKILRTVLALGLIVSTTPALSKNLQIHGSNTIGATLMPTLVEAWLTDRGYQVIDNRLTAENERLMSASHTIHGALDITIHAHGSGTAFKGILANAADLGMASRPIKPSERSDVAHIADLTESGKEIVVGLDGIAVVVHPSNPINHLTIDQLRAIFSGQVTNWSELGGTPRPIQVYARDNKSGTFDTFKSLVLGKKATLASRAKRYESNDQLSDDVAADLNGIGFTGLPSVRRSKPLAIAEGDNTPILPSELSVATEDYPLSRRLFLYNPFNDEPLLRDLVQFVKSQKGQQQVAKVGFISQNIAPYEVGVDSRAPSNYKATVQGAERLSLNFRFKPREYQLDNKALQDVDRLVDFLQKNPQYKVVLAGFSDAAEEAAWRSYILSMERSDFVANQLIKKGIVPSVVRGFGSTLQVASNHSEKGRDKNRRVEVWVR